MYLLFRYKNIMPSDYYWRGPGEKRILRAFMTKEIEEKNKTADILDGIG